MTIEIDLIDAWDVIGMVRCGDDVWWEVEKVIVKSADGGFIFQGDKRLGDGTDR